MISICIPVYGCRATFQSCFKRLDDICAEDNTIDLCVAFWGCKADVPGFLSNVSNLTCTSAPFSRGFGRNLASSLAKYEQLFFLDADMLIDKAVIDTACTILSEGKAFFPVCKDILTPAGTLWRWRPQGTGNCAVTKAILKAVGGWDEFTGWGGEDTRFYNKVAKKTTIVRGNYSGLVHQWHAKPII